MEREKIKDWLKEQIRQDDSILFDLKDILREFCPNSSIFLEYPVEQKRRWDEDNPNRFLNEIIGRNRLGYQKVLECFLKYRTNFKKIKLRPDKKLGMYEPTWINGWMPALDSIALYSFIAMHRPSIYIEIGSGNSTKFAHQAIIDHGLSTKIISIDPMPRAEIDDLCDEVIREPVENLSSDLFAAMNKKDILYIDNSHRAFMNSDATAVFLDILPSLRPHVLVQIHDVTLPYDYPADWADRFYSEQYLLGSYLLADGEKFKIIFPGAFVSNDGELTKTLSPIWEDLKGVERHGCSFWIETEECSKKVGP